MMDKSVDSIGSCSLDVDASSTDFSDSSVGSSDCTLRSLGIPTPTTQPPFRLKTDNFDIFEAKKPSYLNLACTVNGYSNITNYDSKLRDNFRIPRSREVSPIRPQDYHAPQHHPTDIKSKFLSPPPPSSTQYTNSPSKKMSESKSQTILRNSSTTTNYSNSYASKKIIYSSSSDTVDQAAMRYSSSNTTSKISFSSTINGKSEAYEYINGGDKSFIQQRVERLYGPGALAQGFFNSKRTKSRLSECSENGDGSFLNGSMNGSMNGAQHSGSAANSSNSSKSPKLPKSPECDLKQSASSPQLPVLRHLRPEFRAQLPILSPKRTPDPSKSTPVPLSSLVGSIVTNGTEAKRNGENKENIDKQILLTDTMKPVKLTDIITEEIPAAPQVVLPVSLSNGNIKLNGATNGAKEEIKDGHYFLKILKNEQERLICLAVIAEQELEESIGKMTDEQLGYLRSASGKARLLVNQKMQQFEGLCHKNINKIEGEQFPTTTEDLQGFWDMVMLQVVQIDELFAELDRIRANNWIIEEKLKVPEASKTTKKIVVKKAVSAKAEAERKQREAARKKLIEDRRKAMRAKHQQPEEQSIEIFVPAESS